jgi:hypothetical protein
MIHTLSILNSLLSSSSWEYAAELAHIGGHLTNHPEFHHGKDWSYESHDCCSVCEMSHCCFTLFVFILRDCSESNHLCDLIQEVSHERTSTFITLLLADMIFVIYSYCTDVLCCKDLCIVYIGSVYANLAMDCFFFGFLARFGSDNASSECDCMSNATQTSST